MQRTILTISVCHLLIEVFYFTQAALIPVMIQEFNLNLLDASLVVSVPSLVALLAYFPSGLLADVLSPNQLLFASMTIEGSSILIASQARSYWLLVAALCFTCIARPVYHASGVTQISRIAKSDELNMAMGIHNALGDLGTAAGVSSLAFFLTFLSWRWAYALWAIPVLCWGIVVLRSSKLRMPRSTEPRQSAKRSNIIHSILVFSFVIFLVFVAIRELGSTSVSTFVTTFLVVRLKVSAATASLVFGLGAFVGIVGDLAGGYLGKWLSTKKALVFCMFCCIAMLVALGFVSGISLFIIVYLAYAFFDFAVWSPMHTLVAEITPDKTRGLSYSTYFFVHTLMFSLAPMLAAGFIQLYGIAIIFPLGVVLLATALAMLTALRERSLMNLGSPKVLTPMSQPKG
ncbi:MAG TPA: MFS transporter [Candidatus Acidoferrales bacterium]|nr:MFS transporter [Candidatus Acidoferrales bacterium]